jgi:hypothetical protein
MAKRPENRNVLDHLKAGVKNVPKVYQALYNRPGPGGGASTIKNNLKVIAKGKTTSLVSGGKKYSAGVRAGLVGAGAASVTPLGPVVAVGMGIAKSVKDTIKAKAAVQARQVQAKLPTTGQAPKKVGGATKPKAK